MQNWKCWVYCCLMTQMYNGRSMFITVLIAVTFPWIKVLSCLQSRTKAKWYNGETVRWQRCWFPNSHKISLLCSVVLASSMFKLLWNVLEQTQKQFVAGKKLVYSISRSHSSPCLNVKVPNQNSIRIASKNTVKLF